MSIYDGKQYEHDVIHFMRKDIVYGDGGSTISMGWLPAMATVINCGVNVDVVFNGDTTNTVDIGFRNAGDGTSDNTDCFLDGASLETAGRILGTTINTAADTIFPEGAEVVCVVVSTASSSAGTAQAWIEYTVDNT
jgi:hypothetical protein